MSSCDLTSRHGRFISPLNCLRHHHGLDCPNTEERHNLTVERLLLSEIKLQPLFENRELPS